MVILVVGLGYAAYLLLQHTEARSLSVSELKFQAASFYSQQVRVEGRIAPGSTDWNDKAQVIRFALTDEKESLTVVYQGVVPDTFKPGAELVVEGVYRPDGTFEALGFGRRRSLCNLCHS